MIEDAYLVGINSNSFRAGIPALIVGLKILDIREEKRICYHIRFSDGYEDFTPLIDVENYKIISFYGVINMDFKKEMI